MEILNSATRLTLLWVMFILGLLMGYTGVIGIWRGTLDPKDILAIFSSVVSFIVGFYFSKRDDKIVDNKMTTEK